MLQMRRVEDRMTAYVETERVAHVMEWREYGPAWRSLCTRGPKISPSEWDDAREWPMRYATADRTKPFCRLCVDILARNVRTALDDVLIPASVESAEIGEVLE